MIRSSYFLVVVDNIVIKMKMLIRSFVDLDDRYPKLSN